MWAVTISHREWEESRCRFSLSDVIQFSTSCELTNRNLRFSSLNCRFLFGIFQARSGTVNEICPCFPRDKPELNMRPARLSHPHIWICIKYAVNESPLDEVGDIVDRFSNCYSFSVIEECSRIEYGWTWRPSIKRDHVSSSSRTLLSSEGTALWNSLWPFELTYFAHDC